MLPVLKESSKGGKRNNISYLKNKYKEISQMLGESKIKKKKMLWEAGAWWGTKLDRKLDLPPWLSKGEVPLLQNSKLQAPALQTQQRTIFPLTFSSVALPLLPGRWSGNKREFPTLRSPGPLWQGDHLAGPSSRNCGSSEPLTAFPTDDRPYSRSRSSSMSSSRELWQIIDQSQ